MPSTTGTTPAVAVMQRRERSAADEAGELLPHDAIPAWARDVVARAARDCAAGRNDAVIRATDGLDATATVDDPTALLLVYRAVALARVGLFRSAMTVFRRVLGAHDRGRDLRHFALRQRAEVYAAEGRRAQARRDLRAIVTEDPTAADAKERLVQLRAR
ncbi:MAG: hypothetical protein KY460_02170 [Actinobacteria bacterium]|nr:hypothetical protein [Actinomycetota bacterium]